MSNISDSNHYLLDGQLGEKREGEKKNKTKQ